MASGLTLVSGCMVGLLRRLVTAHLLFEILAELGEPDEVARLNRHRECFCRVLEWTPMPAGRQPPEQTQIPGWVALAIVRQIAHPSTPGHRYLSDTLGWRTAFELAICPLDVQRLNVGQMPLSGLKTPRSGREIQIAHHLGDHADFRLGERVASLGEEIAVVRRG